MGDELTEAQRIGRIRALPPFSPSPPPREERAGVRRHKVLRLKSPHPNPLPAQAGRGRPGQCQDVAQRIYDQLWSKTSAALESGRLRGDPLLRGKAGDPRRGATLVARPNADVRKRVEKFLREAAAICPGQHIYQPAELHVTVLSVIPGSESWREEIRRLPVCRTVLNEVLKNCRAFSVKFRRVTVSPEAVLVQGFPQDDALSRLRDELRSALRDRGVGENLDRRYKITAAHLTVMRFSNPKADWKRLFDFLQAHRETDFGETRFQSLQLIWNDWCASTGATRTLQEYALKD